MKKESKNNKGVKIFNEEFEKELENLINLKIKESALKLAEEDIKKITDTLTPYFDKIISDKIKTHMVFIGKTLIDSIKE